MSEPFPNADIIKVVSAARNTEPREDIVECCVVCGDDIQMQVFRGTGVCSELHRKQRDKVAAEERALAP